MNKAPEILRVDPVIAIPGGEVAIDCAEFDTSDPTACAVWFGKERAPLVALSARRALAIVPELKQTSAVAVTVESPGGRSAEASIVVGRRLAEDLHPVTNPAFDSDDGALFVTRSGSRGEQLPVTLFRIDVNGEVTEFSGDITNPTGIAFDSRGQMFVSSRMDGSIYRITPFKEAVPFAHGLGVATGIAALGAVFQSKITDSLHTLLPQAPSGFADGVAASGTQAANQAPPQFHDQAFQAAGVAFTDAFNDILLIGALILFSGALAVFALVRQRDFVPYAPSAPAETPAQEPARAA